MLRISICEKQPRPGASGGCPKSVRGRPQSASTPSTPATGLWLAWGPRKHCTFVTPRRNQPPPLEMGKWSPREAGDLSEDAQLAGRARVAREDGCPPHAPLTSHPCRQPSPQEGLVLAISAPALPAWKRRASVRASAAEGVRSQRGVSMGRTRGEGPFCQGRRPFNCIYLTLFPLQQVTKSISTRVPE